MNILYPLLFAALILNTKTFSFEGSLNLFGGMSFVQTENSKRYPVSDDARPGFTFGAETLLNTAPYINIGFHSSMATFALAQSGQTHIMDVYSFYPQLDFKKEWGPNLHFHFLLGAGPDLIWKRMVPKDARTATSNTSWSPGYEVGAAVGWEHWRIMSSLSHTDFFRSHSFLWISIKAAYEFRLGK